MEGFNLHIRSVAMNKSLLIALVSMSLCGTAFAEQQFTNRGEERYAGFTEENVEIVEADQAETSAKKSTAALPIRLTADHAEYDGESGDFEAKGNVVVIQGKEKITTVHAKGNLQTGDILLERGGTVTDVQSTVTGKWAHYNFNTKNGELKEISGKSEKDFFKGDHAFIENGKIVLDQGAVSSRCPAVKHPPCLSVSAKTVEIYPKDRIVAHNVKVYVKGKHIYSKDLWINRLDGSKQSRIMPRLGFDSRRNGFYGKLDVSLPVSARTEFNAELKQYSKAGFRPMYSAEHDAKNFRLSYKYGWEEDDDIWYKKKNTWRFDYKTHRIAAGLPLTYSGYFEYGLWRKEHAKYQSWHKEYAVYLNHDPIRLFNSDKTTLNLTVGKKWVNESYTGDTVSTNMYYATLRHKFDAKWSTWMGYYRERRTSELFDIGQADMNKELRNGLQFHLDDKNTFTVVNRYDLDKKEQYETNFRWLHRFCCWALELDYTREHAKDDHTFRVHYYFYNF